MKVIGPEQHRSTRLAFFTAGLAMAAWAPLVPYAKARIGLGEAELGLLLLCFGGGSMLAMPFTGGLAGRFGCRAVVLLSGFLCCLMLPVLALANSSPLLALTLFVFGVGLGTLDVAMNIQAVIVEKSAGAALMSGFHGLFSVGGVAGAGSMAFLLWSGASPLYSCVIISIVAVFALALASPNLLREIDAAESKVPLFVVPHGAVIIIGGVCFIVFMAEGAMLDWSALFLTAQRGLSGERAGLGYAIFSIAMMLGRLTGDHVVARFGGRRVMLAGGICSASGFLFAVSTSSGGTALAGFLLVGLGASNIVPILFTAAGKQTAMPASRAIAAITTIGYAGILSGPALIGFVAHVSNLNLAFGGLGCLMLLVALSNRLGSDMQN